MTTSRPKGSTARSRGAVALDVAIGALILASLAFTLWRPEARDLLTLTVGCVSLAALFWRRRFPVTVLVVVCVLAVVSCLLYDDSAELLPLSIALFTVVAGGRRRLGSVVALGMVLVLVVLELGVRRWPADDVVVALTVLLPALAVAVGAVSDSRRRVLEAAEDRALRAEELRDLAAAQAVAEERLRIARDLHDSLAHQVAVIGVQAGAAEYMVETDPAAAKDAMATVRVASSEALQELSVLVGLLRRDSGDLVPVPGLDRLDDLLRQARDMGLEVTARISELPTPRPAAVDIAAYRVVQESLTNAHKHGAGAVELEVRATEGRLEIDVSNRLPAGGKKGAGSGFGLVGLAERVEAVGGTLATRLAEGRFVLRAELPLRPEGVAS